MAGLVIDSRREGPIGILRLSGEARLEVSDAIRTSARALAAGGTKHLLLSLKAVTFVDSASVGAVLELDKEISAAGGLLVLYAIPTRVARMLDAMGLTGRFRIAADEAAALKACGA